MAQEIVFFIRHLLGVSVLDQIVNLHVNMPLKPLSHIHDCEHD